MNYDCCLVTGGTGTFGTAYVVNAIKNRWHKKIIVYSRDEYKQIKMFSFLKDMFDGEKIEKESAPFSIEINDVCIRFLIGNVCDYERLCVATRDVDLVIHAAALKHVPTCEYNAIEATKTNIGGTTNVVNSCGINNVKKVIALSTDKAVDPVNIYGATKLCLEKVILGGNRYYPQTTMSVVRYGNIIGSRGSIIHKLLTHTGNSIGLTDPDMTRFWLTIEDAVDLVRIATASKKKYVVYIPKLKALRLGDLFEIMRPDLDINIIGARPGEKIHEKMITEIDLYKTFESVDLKYLATDMSSPNDKHNIGSDGEGFKLVKAEKYTSDVADKFTKEEFLSMLKGSLIGKLYDMEMPNSDLLKSSGIRHGR
jgi:UDP-N-acetylglucosamine 4,6-dehydratase/5-epimerase